MCTMQPATRPEAGPWPHTGVVLAGGASRRMGRPKHELKLPDGRTMLEVVTEALREVCARVVVTGDMEIGLQRVADLRPDQGPLGGIEAILASGLDAQYLVCPCDMPLVTGTLLQRLTGPADGGATVFQIEGEDSVRPLPARISSIGATSEPPSSRSTPMSTAVRAEFRQASDVVLTTSI